VKSTSVREDVCEGGGAGRSVKWGGAGGCDGMRPLLPAGRKFCKITQNRLNKKNWQEKFGGRTVADF
jgi:hypothetical protein